ncbi:MAG: LysE family transporter, partial [Pseudomonadales bacterium]|nr:LysE family transporter [Pseudomonadales bacterium]
EDQQASAKQPAFVDGFLINLLNAKAYAVFLAVFSQFLLPGDSPIVAYGLTGLVCFGMGVTVNITWLWFGSAISPLFRRPRAARILRSTFAVLMVVAVVAVVIP